jgi:hypothetical protein
MERGRRRRWQSPTESERLRRIFEDAQVLRKPVLVVTGYHMLPNVC